MPPKIGSPVYSVYRIASMLKIACRTIATVAIRKIAEEYLTAAAGPTSHSPPPIDVAAMIAPGPMTCRMLRKPKGGGAGRSATFHCGNAP